MQADDIRAGTWRRLAQFGVAEHAALPLLEDISPRSAKDVEVRALALYGYVATVFGFDRSRVRDWLAGEGLLDGLSRAEAEALEDVSGAPPATDRESVEALWTLLWTLGHVHGLDPTRWSDDDMVDLFPDVRGAESTKGFRAVSSLRDPSALIEALDLHYCLHWASRARLLDRRATKVLPEWALRQRRHALEWVLHPDEPWDDVTLDT